MEFPLPDSQIVTAADQAAPWLREESPSWSFRGRAGMADPDNCHRHAHLPQPSPSPPPHSLARPPPAKLTQPSQSNLDLSAEQMPANTIRRPQHAAAYLVLVNKADAPGANRADLLTGQFGRPW